MKAPLFPRLALIGIIKNKKFYLPYLLSSIGMITMYFIIQSLSVSPLVTGMYHGGEIGMMLSLGKFVIVVFSLLFLFYINSFLVKRRYREFGLYNILGMNKRNIAAIVFWESVFSSFASLVCGTALGIAFSKLAELGLMNMAKQAIAYDFVFSAEAVTYTIILYGLIFLLLMLKSLIVVSRTKPLELMQSQSYGEKPLKANWVLTVLGLLILGGAYYMAVTIENPLSALLLFFVAVIMVIVGTYLLFISGSVALCKLLQKNKKYYYKKNHFISVSSMSYRMSRNGAGLASIAILSTMVLVMISTTGSLYFGAENAMRSRYPRDTEISLELDSLKDMQDGTIGKIKNGYQEIFDSYDFTPVDALEYRYSTVTGYLTDEYVEVIPPNSMLIDYNHIKSMYFVSLDDFNKAMNTSYSLSDGEAMLYTMRCDYDGDDLKIGELKLHISQRLNSFIEIGDANTAIMPSFMLVIQDYDVLKPLDETTLDGENSVLLSKYHYSYNSDRSDEETIRIYKAQLEILPDMLEGNIGYLGGCLAAEKDDFYSTFGGMFFLGIILSIVFIFAATVIIYYKQVSEGYEDQKRFEIMQNVGMTKKDIKSNINSQILTVFFAPFITAGIHLCFAFPFLWKILQMFHITNLAFVIATTLVAFVVFGIFYALIYKVTARAYFGIVSKKE